VGEDDVRGGPSVLLVSAFDPHAIGNGSSARARRWCEALAGGAHFDAVVVPVVASDPASPYRRVRLPDDDECARGAVHLAGPRWRDWMVRSAPLPAMADRAPAWLGRTLLEGMSWRPDVVVAFKMSVALVAADLAFECGAPLVVDLDDDEPSLAVPGAERDALERLVRGVGDLATLITVASESDRAQVQARVAAPVVVVPNVVPLPEPATDRRAGRALYVANFGYPPNRESARWLFDEVVPRATGLERLDVVGAGSEAVVPAGHAVAVAHGRVADLEPFYRSAAVVVCPVLRGSGTSIKVLEAMAHECPVVTTSVGARGLAIEDGRHAVVTDDPADFAAAVSRWCRLDPAAREVAAAGRRLVEQRYSLAAGATAMRAVVTSALTTGPR